jgi:hypothetical protein
MTGWQLPKAIVDRCLSDRNQAPHAGTSPTLTHEMSTPDPAPQHDENLELPVDELLQRAKVHPPYGEQVIDDLTPEEADAFLDAILS